MKVCVVGLGYIGLSTAAMFAKSGFDVVGADNNESVIQSIYGGKKHINEPGLGDIIEDAIAQGRLRAGAAPEKADVFIIAVPTPNNSDAYLSCDLKYVVAAAQSIVPFLEKGNVIIVESTISPGTTEDVIKPMFEKAGFSIGSDLFLSHCPERVLPGRILYELEYNDRIIGGVTAACADKAADIYGRFVKGRITRTEAKTAETSKLVENTFRDVNIAFANELAKICIELGINVLDVIEMANRHPRVNVHWPGPGVGGHCLAVDPYFIYAKAPDTARLIKMARDINNGMPEYIAEKAEQLLGHQKSKKIAALGVTYKPDVNDTRESPALKVIGLLADRGYRVSIHDPHVHNSGYLGFEEAIIDADMILCLVGHRAFQNMDFNKINKDTIIFDVTSALKHDRVVNLGNLHRALVSRA